jgi:hypothetical protein
VQYFTWAKRVVDGLRGTHTVLEGIFDRTHAQGPWKYPQPDRSDFTPNLTKTAENEDLDLGWTEGVLSDGRPYRAECWATGGLTLVTMFFATEGMETWDNADLADLLVRGGLFEAGDGGLQVEARPHTDASGNPMWSVNVVVGDEDGLMATDRLRFRPYHRDV